MQKDWTGVGRQFGKILHGVAMPYLIFKIPPPTDRFQTVRQTYTSKELVTYAATLPD
jgi:hypothetical protein